MPLREMRFVKKGAVKASAAVIPGLDGFIQLLNLYIVSL